MGGGLKEILRSMEKDCGVWTQRINTRRHGARGDSTTRALREIPIEQAFAFLPRFPPESTGLLEVTVSAEKALHGG